VSRAAAGAILVRVVSTATPESLARADYARSTPFEVNALTDPSLALVVTEGVGHDAKTFAVTHAPSGVRVCAFSVFKSAVRAVARLEPLADWASRSFEDLSADRDLALDICAAVEKLPGRVYPGRTR
jgi:hypothetical protein